MEWRIANEDQKLYINGTPDGLIQDDTKKIFDLFNPQKDLYILLKSTAPHIPNDDDDDFEKEDLSGHSTHTVMRSYYNTTHLDDDSYDSRPQLGYVGLKNQGNIQIQRLVTILLSLLLLISQKFSPTTKNRSHVLS